MRGCSVSCFVLFCVVLCVLCFCFVVISVVCFCVVLVCVSVCVRVCVVSVHVCVCVCRYFNDVTNTVPWNAAEEKALTKLVLTYGEGLLFLCFAVVGTVVFVCVCVCV